MLYDARIKKMAQVLVNYSVQIKKGQRVYIRGWDAASPLLQEIYREVLRVGGLPDIVLAMDGFEEIYYTEASDEQLEDISPLLSIPREKYDALISVDAPSNTRRLSGIDSKKIAKRSNATGKIMQTVLERSAAGELKWVGTDFPCLALAQEAGMSLEDYTEFLFEACHLNDEDPVAHWKKVHDEQEKIVEYLNNVKEIHLIAKDTDLKANVEGRKWINCDGCFNFPDGEVFTTPIEDSTNGHIRYTFPAINQGNKVEDIQLKFKNGKVIEASAASGEVLLHALLDTDEGAKYLGELAIGTNFGIQKFTHNILFDEKIGGTVHLAVGACYPETGGKNQSGLHWDMICDMRQEGKILADGKLIYEKGKFLVF